MPAHSPGANMVVPINRRIPLFVPEELCTITRSPIFAAGGGLPNLVGVKGPGLGDLERNGEGDLLKSAKHLGGVFP